MLDVLIIGAGVTGSSIARELSKRNLKIAVVDKSSDICEGTSKANSGIVHGGFDAKPGSLKARLNVEGNRLMEEYSKMLDFPFKRNGSLVLLFDEKDRVKLEELYDQGVENGVEGLKIVERDELKQLEPHVSERAVAALYVPTGGIVCPFNLTIAMAENAAVNGVDFYLNTEVKSITKCNDKYTVKCADKEFESRVVINAAGVYADVFHNMVSDNKLNITPRKGEYCLMDKRTGGYVEHTLFQLPTELGKGVLVTPTVHGNLLVGPTAEDIEDKEGVYTTSAGLEQVLQKSGLSVEQVPSRQIITSFAGLRAHEDGDDFIIEECADSRGFIDVCGVESPGLSCAPAIGRYVSEIVDRTIETTMKEDFIEKRQGIVSMSEADAQTRQKMIDIDPAYGNIICRCEMVTEGEIKSAINRPLGATTLDGVKRRTRAGMGRCQAGFCSPKTVAILARELGVTAEEITKSGDNSYFLQ